MKNKIIIGFGVVAVAVIAFVLLIDFEDAVESPKDKAEINSANIGVSLTYGRPSVRGRTIFGTAAEQALQPHGKYWRLGANEATEITFNRDVTFNGSPIKAGTYRVYAIPGADSFEIGLNSQTGQWGYDEPDYSKDVLKTSVPAQKTSTPVEQLTIALAEAEGGADMIVEWANVRLHIPIR